MTKRNDSRLNNHQQLQLQGWRANCDMQVVIYDYACVEYLTCRKNRKLRITNNSQLAEAYSFAKDG